MIHHTAATGGDELLAEITKCAAATRKSHETAEMAFARVLQERPGTIAEMGRQAALAKRRLTAPAIAELPDVAYDALVEKAQRMVDVGEAPTVPQAFAKLYEARNPEIRALVKAAKARAAAVLGATATDDDDAVVDPVDNGNGAADDYDTGRSLDPNAGGGGATGGLMSRGRAQSFSEVMAGGKPAAGGTREGSYDPSRRPPSATREVPSSATSRSYARPDQAIGKRTVVRKVDEDRLVKRGKQLIDRGFSVSEALYIASAPRKAARRRLAKRIAAQKARAA